MTTEFKPGNKELEDFPISALFLTPETSGEKVFLQRLLDKTKDNQDINILCSKDGVFLISIYDNREEY